MRARHNDTIDVTLDNKLDKGTLVHWHGIRVPYVLGEMLLTAPLRLTEITLAPGQRADVIAYVTYAVSIDNVAVAKFGCWETSPDGEPTFLRDATLVAVGQAVDILCVCENPGAWLLHCHMLSYSADGMVTWFKVG